jgi:probable HAF family extracellular repeat protein
VAGRSDDDQGRYRAFVYADLDADGTEEMVDIGDLSGGSASAHGINNYGEIAGGSADTSGRGRAFRDTPADDNGPAVMEDLGDFGFYTKDPGTGCGAHDINDAGHVVGQTGNLKKIRNTSAV